MAVGTWGHVALIKGNKVDQSGVVTVQGDQVIAENVSSRGRPRPSAEKGLPNSRQNETAATDPFGAQDDQDVFAGSEWEEPSASDRVRVRDREGSPVVTPFIVSDDLDQDPQPVSTTPDSSRDDVQNEAIRRWDSSRQHVLDAAEEQAEIKAQEEVAEQADAQAHYSRLQQDATSRLVDSLGDRDAALHALDAIVPALERQAAAHAEYEAIATTSRVKWQELATAEEQIAALLERFEIPADAARGILAERERLLAEARLEATRQLTQAQENAAYLKADAEAQGAQVLEDFEAIRSARFEQLREEARAAGYTEGRSQADEEGAKIIEEAIETLNRARLAYPKAVRENQEKLIELALNVAEKIVGDEIITGPDLVLKTLEAALTKVTDLESVSIRVNTVDLPQLQAQEERYRDMLSQVKKLEFIGSAKIARGGVFIETNSGTVDATIKTQLSVLAEVLRNVHKEIEVVDQTETEAFEELG